jgi:hypothetical protein
MLDRVGSTAASVIVELKRKGVGRKRPAPKPKPTPPQYVENGHFSRCPAAAVFDPNLTDGELRALAAAGAFTEKQTMICRASQITIANRLGVHRQSVSRWFAALVAKGYMALERTTRRAHGGRGPNVYRLIYPAMKQGGLEAAKDSQIEDESDHPSGQTEICA